MSRECTCEDFAPVVQTEHFHSLSETVVGNLSFLTPVFCKLQEVGKGEERDTIGDRRKKGVSPTSQKKYFYSFLKREGDSCPCEAK